MRGHVSKEFGNLPRDEQKVMAKYLFQISAMKGSGEFSLNILFETYHFIYVGIMLAHTPIKTDLETL